MDHNASTMKNVIKARDLALKSARQGGGPFGAVIIKDGHLVATGMNRVTADSDPTAHAEINAIRSASKKLKTHDLAGCEIYCSCEPCPMCLGAIYWSRIDHIYYACSIEDAAKFGFDDANIFKEFSLPVSERSIPATFLKIDQAQVAFKYWDGLEDKVRY